MQYINGHAPQGTFVNKINKEVAKVKENKEMEKSYMTYAMEIERRERIARNIGLEEGMKEGIQKGLKEGMQKGMKKGLAQTALAMLEENIPLDVISKCTSLTIQEIEVLAKEHHVL